MIRGEDGSPGCHPCGPTRASEVTGKIDAEIRERISELCRRVKDNESDLANELFGRVSGFEDILRQYYGV